MNRFVHVSRLRQFTVLHRSGTESPPAQRRASTAVTPASLCLAVAAAAAAAAAVRHGAKGKVLAALQGRSGAATTTPPIARHKRTHGTVSTLDGFFDHLCAR